MGKELFEKYGIRQLGYSVESIEETAQLYHDLFGAGPFIDMGVNAPESCKIRGVEQPVKMRTAIGYLGDMEIELIEDKSDCPSPRTPRRGVTACITTASGSTTCRRQSTNLPLPASRSPWTWSRAPGCGVVYVDAREQLGQYHRDQSAARTSAADGHGRAPEVAGMTSPSWAFRTSWR